MAKVADFGLARIRSGTAVRSTWGGTIQVSGNSYPGVHQMQKEKLILFAFLITNTHAHTVTHTNVQVHTHTRKYTRTPCST